MSRKKSIVLLLLITCIMLQGCGTTFKSTRSRSLANVEYSADYKYVHLFIADEEYVYEVDCMQEGMSESTIYVHDDNVSCIFLTKNHGVEIIDKENRPIIIASNYIIKIEED
jgi:hypothetical protein